VSGKASYLTLRWGTDALRAISLVDRNDSIALLSCGLRTTYTKLSAIRDGDLCRSAITWTTTWPWPSKPRSDFSLATTRVGHVSQYVHAYPPARGGSRKPAQMVLSELARAATRRICTGSPGFLSTYGEPATGALFPRRMTAYTVVGHRAVHSRSGHPFVWRYRMVCTEHVTSGVHLRATGCRASF